MTIPIVVETNIDEAAKPLSFWAKRRISHDGQRDSSLRSEWQGQIRM